MRLCRTNRTASTCNSPPTLTASADEWGFACGYQRSCGSNPTFPYGCTYGATTCNGYDNGAGTTVATGSKIMCTTNDLDPSNGHLAYDMSGNISEWTEDCRGILGDGTNRRIFTLRGGAYDSENCMGLTSVRCDFYSVLVAEDFSHPTTGFRCCSSCAAGTTRCGNSCVDLGTSNSHCGVCGNDCGGGTCQNGVCR